MAAPDYVPRRPTEQVRVYTSPPWRPEPWTADRPADLTEATQPTGDGFGWQGPDQGYALLLARRYEDELVLTDGESAADASAGAVIVALKRASLFGRAPVRHDLTTAFTVWGFLGSAPDELVALRRSLFEGVSHEHHYAERLQIGDFVPADILRQPHTAVMDAAAADWRSVLDVAAAETAASQAH